MDFMILYEHNAREIESACILKKELERNGFSAEIYSIYSLMKSIKKANVIIVPHLYNDEQVAQFICKYKLRKCKVINLQYEQVISINDIQTGYGYPRGQAKNALLLAWGNHENSRYIKDEKQRSEVVGCLAMDLNLPKYDDLFFGKSYLYDKYKFNSENKILIFISSFSLADVTDEYLQLHYNENFDVAKQFAKISKRSQEIVIGWLMHIAKNGGWEVIYRPHPAEYENKRLKEIEENIKGFHVISDESVRQWIRVSDFITTWFSTSIIDAYYAGKPCVILRPEKIPEELDVPFMIDAHSVSTYEEFIEKINAEDKGEFPIKEEDIHDFYANKKGEECLRGVVKRCIDVYNSNIYEHTYNVRKYYDLFSIIKTFFIDVLFELSRYLDLTAFYKIALCKNPAKKSFFIHVQKELYKSHKLINDICARI